MDFTVTPYRICAAVFIDTYYFHFCPFRVRFRQNIKVCVFILDLIKQTEYSFQQMLDLLESNLLSSEPVVLRFRRRIDELVEDINNMFDLIRDIREFPKSKEHCVAGLFIRKLSIYFDRLTHQATSRLYDDLLAYVSGQISIARRRLLLAPIHSQRVTRSTEAFSEAVVSSKSRHINHEIAKLQANELEAMNPQELYEYICQPNNSSKSDAFFLRYLNLLRVNESVGSKHLLMAYFDMVSDSVSRSYSALNYAIWYLHHREYRRAIECLQECYCCAQAADDDKCLLNSLMWLARIVIQAKQRKSSRYNVIGLLELVKKRSQKSGMPYVQAMATMALDQLNGPRDDSEMLKKSSTTLKQVALNNRQQNNLLAATVNQPCPLDKDDESPSAEILAVRNSMNDVLAMYYGLMSAHYNLIDANQSSTLASQTLLHLDLIEKCGKEDILLLNENIFIAMRNIAYHVWNSTRNFCLVREILVDLCSNNIPTHRTDHHSIWRQALAEISFEYYMDQKNWVEADKMVDLIHETDQDGSILRKSELLMALGIYEEALQLVDGLIAQIEQDGNLSDLAAFSYANAVDAGDSNSIQSMEHRAFIKSKALLLQAKLLNDETKILESLNYASENRFMHIRIACLIELAKRWSTKTKTDKVIDSIVIEVFANGTKTERSELRSLNIL